MLYPPSSLYNVGMRGGDDEEIDRPATRGTRGGNSVRYAVIHQCYILPHHCTL